jgi:hypothetical protein
MTKSSLDLTIRRQVDQPGSRVIAGFDSGRATVVIGTAWAVPAAEELADLFLRANTEHHVAGISAGIGSNRRQKKFYIQLVIALGDCRPGALRKKL